MAFDANGNWSQPNDGNSYALGGSVPSAGGSWFQVNAPPNPSGIVRQPTGDFGAVHADSDPIQGNSNLPPEIQTWGQYREALKTQPWLGSSEGPGGFSGHAQDGGGLSGSMSDWLGGGMTDTGGGIVRQPSATLQNGGASTGGIPGAFGSGNAILPGTSTNGGNPTPVFPGVGGSGNAQMFPQGGSTAPAAGAAPSLGSTPADDAALTAWLKSQGIQDADLPYWKSSINSKTDGLQAGNAQYWMDKIKGGQAAGGGTGSSSGVGFGSFLQPFTGTFTPPKGTDDPGFQFAVNQGADQLARKAAALGNLNTGGFAKDLASYTTGAALQDYSGAYNRALSTFGTNYDIFRNNQTDPYNKLMGVTGLGLNATNNENANTGSYMNNLTDLTTGQGNVNAGSTIGNANANNTAISGLANWFQNYHPTTYGLGY